MILDKVILKQLDETVKRFELANKDDDFNPVTCVSVSDVYKGLVRLIKKSDRMDLDEVTAVLYIVAMAIVRGQSDVIELYDYLREDFLDRYTRDLPGEGETGMKNADGSVVTLKELGIE